MKSFFDYKDGKISEKTFSQTMIISVVSILLCIVVLCSLTYAWFTTESKSNSNTLVSGTFDVVISVKNEHAIPVEPESNSDNKYVYRLQPGTYEITLKLTESSTVKGHCVVNIGNGPDLHTAAIIGTNTANVDTAEITDPFTFKIVVTENTTLTLTPRWSIAADPDIANNSTYTAS